MNSAEPAASAAPTPAKVLTKSEMKRAARDSGARTRNVLFNPFRVEWPPVAKQDAAAVLEAVSTHFEQFDIPSGIGQEEYCRLLAAGDRAGITVRRRQLREQRAPLLEARRRHLADCVLGFNAASRALEAGQLAALLVEADTPALETRFLAPLAAGRRCPAVCVPRLRPALRRRLGLETAVLGLRPAAAEPGHPLRPLVEAVRRAAEPPPPDAGGPPGPGCTAPPTEERVNTPEPPPPPPPAAERGQKRQASPDQLLDNVIYLDTEGMPHKKRLELKEARVMKITLGNKALKKARKKHK